MTFKCEKCEHHNIKKLKCDKYNKVFKHGYALKNFSNIHCDKIIN